MTERETKNKTINEIYVMFFRLSFTFFTSTNYEEKRMPVPSKKKGRTGNAYDKRMFLFTSIFQHISFANFSACSIHRPNNMPPMVPKLKFNRRILELIHLFFQLFNNMPASAPRRKRSQ